MMSRQTLLALIVGCTFLLPGASFATTDRVAAQSDFKVCESTYALCTTAECTPVAGKDGELSCACDVKTGYSAGLEPCQDVTETDQGKAIRSRYFPVRSYAACANERPWGWCLDKPCTIDPDDPTKATCACTSTEKQGPYVIITDGYSADTCAIGIYSSATVKQLEEVTDFLKTSPDLKPFPIDVVGPDK